MGVGPIPFSKIEEYGLRRGFSGEHLERFCSLIEAMDVAHMDWLAEQKGRDE